MVITGSTIISRNDTARISWGGLKQFHHIPTVFSKLVELHQVPNKHHPNVKKQATQIRYCLQQAREYRDAASVTSLATKPLLLYYSIMSLALAEMLFKSDGSKSLDAARGEHAHHGLTLNVAQNSPELELSTAASSLIAKPMVSSGKRRGTFELWHQVARESPVIGVQREHFASNNIVSTQLLLGSEDKRMGSINPDGISLLDCFTGSPGMFGHFVGSKLSSRALRGRFARQINKGANSIEDELIIHPGNVDVVSAIAKEIAFEPRSFENLAFVESPNSILLRATYEYDNQIMYRLPKIASWTKDEMFFLRPDIPLNEFGYLYIGLYILGNYARYFPDKWMQDVEGGSPLSIATEEFVDIAESRMALLILGELTSKYYVYTD